MAAGRRVSLIARVGTAVMRRVAARLVITARCTSPGQRKGGIATGGHTLRNSHAPQRDERCMTQPEQQTAPHNPMRETNYYLASIRNILIFWNVLAILGLVVWGLALLLMANTY